jgi:putative spermidine/putrescine transport system substrate-binding protein
MLFHIGRHFAVLTAIALGSTIAHAHCYPGTDAAPLEPQVIFSQNGGIIADTLDKIYFKRFEAECGVKVLSHQATGRTISQLMQFVQSGQAPFDIGLSQSPNEYPIGLTENLFEKFPAGFWNSIKDRMVPQSITDYGVWGSPYTTVMIYSTKVFPDGLHNWSEFWDTKKFPGPRILQNDPTNIIFALQATGLAPSEVHPLTSEKIALAFRKLDEIRPELKTFWKPGDQPIQGVGSGEFVAGTAWVGRAAVARKQGTPLDISWQGGVLNDSWMYILKGAKHPRAAQALLYFMQRPELVAEQAKTLFYANGSTDAMKLLTPDVVAQLPTSPEHIKVSVLLDMDWWSKNGAQIATIWNTWVATGRAPAFK